MKGLRQGQVYFIRQREEIVPESELSLARERIQAGNSPQWPRDAFQQVAESEKLFSEETKVTRREKRKKK